MIQFPLRVAWLHFVLYAGPQQLEYDEHWKSLPDDESSSNE
jgi:hypothetical protein